MKFVKDIDKNGISKVIKNALFSAYSDIRLSSFNNELDNLEVRTELWNEVVEFLKGIDTSSTIDLIEPFWVRNSENIRKDLLTNPDAMKKFTRIPSLRYTLSQAGAPLFLSREEKGMLNYVLSSTLNSNYKKFLRADSVGKPFLISRKYQTSYLRLQHIFELALYNHEIPDKLQSFKRIVEWGGGYGDMCRILYGADETITYAIVDLPVTSIIQYYYLSSIFGKDKVNLVSDMNQLVKEHSINLVPLTSLRWLNMHFQFFLSTFALTESSQKAVDFVLHEQFFGAGNLLIGGQYTNRDFPETNLKLNQIKNAIEVKELVSPVREDVYFLLK
ncbi:MAG: putative sugar O-methyltransferase [Thermoplasmata archaeon]